MPSDAASGGGYAVGVGPGKKRPRKTKKPKPYTLPTSNAPRGDAGHSPSPTPRSTTLPPGPRGDAPQTRKQDMRKAERHKRTKDYERSIRAAYRNASEERRAARRERIARLFKVGRMPRLSIEDSSILKTILNRETRDQMFMKSPIFNDRQHRIVERHKDTLPFIEAMDEAKARRIADETGLKDWRLASENPKQMKAAGLKADPIEAAVTKGYAAALGPLTSAGALAEGLVRSPGKTALGTAKQVPLAVAGIIPGIANAIIHPVETVKDTIEVLGTPYDEKVDRVINEGGLIDLGNAAMMAGPTGASIMRGILRGAPDRAAKLHSGGAERTPRKAGAFRYLLGTTVDAQKARRYERLARAGKELTPLQREALLANREAGRPVKVVPIRSDRKIKVEGVAKPRGRRIAGLKFDMAKGDFGKLNRELMRLKPGEQKALWFASALGVRTPEDAHRELPVLKAKILEHREREGITPLGHEEKMDVAALIDEVLGDADTHFTKNLDDVLTSVAPLVHRISEDEPQFSADVKEARRRGDQAFLLDAERGVDPDPPEGQVTLYHASPKGPDDIGKSGLRAASPVDTTLDEPAGVYLTGDPQMARDYGHHIYRVTVDRDDLRVDPSLPGLARYVENDVDPSQIEYVGKAGIRDARQGRFDNELVDSLPKLDLPADVPPLRYADETDAEFNARVDATAAERGLAEPMYFKSEKQRGGEVDFASMAVGGGKAKSTGRAWAGENIAAGIFDTSKPQFLRGYANNVKAVHNYELMNDLVQRNRLESLSPEPQGQTVGTLLNRINQARPLLRKGDVALINPGIFQTRLHADPDNPHALPEEDLDADAREGMEEAVLAPRKVDALMKAAANGDEEAVLMMRSPGWHAVPKTALRELEAELKAGSMGGRILDIAKGKSSMAILLVLNAPWLAFQVLSEAGVTAAATRGSALNPVNWAGTVKWWKGMNDKQRREVGAALGLGMTGNDTHSIKMGATINGGFSNWYRGMKAKDFWHRPRTAFGGAPVSTALNPIALMRAADQGKTNVNRLLAAHTYLKREVVADMAESMSRHDKAATKLMSVFQMPVHKQADYLTKHPELLEEIADTTADYLGDWTTMTHNERKIANRAIMFYPFVRYSLRLLFYTMPVEHPAMTAVLAELGQLKVDEYREVFGSDDLPWNIGKVYFGETGDSVSIDLARTNPLMNAAVGSLARVGTNSNNIPGAAIGMLPPYAQWLVAHAGWNSFRGRPTRIHGDTSPISKKPWEIGLDEHGKLLVAQVQSLLYPARQAMESLHPGAQSDESSLLFPVPMDYKASGDIEGGGLGNDIRRAKAEEAEAQQRHDAENGGLGGTLLGPLYPTPSRDKAATEAREYIKALEAKQEKERRTPGRGGSKSSKSPFSSGSGGKSPFSGDR